MNKRQFKDQVYGSFAAVAKAMSSPRRVELIELLAQAERPVEWLAQTTGMSMANTSQHLQVLRNAHLVESRKEGLYVWYRLAGPEASGVFAALRQVAEARDRTLAAVVDQFFRQRDALDAVPFEGLVERIRAGELIVVDVRPAEEFAAAHVPGARSVPLNEVADFRAQVQPGQVVVAYCRGPYCVLADQAVRELRANGVDARRLAGGLPEWRQAGLPVTTGTA